MGYHLQPSDREALEELLEWLHENTARDARITCHDQRRMRFTVELTEDQTEGDDDPTFIEASGEGGLWKAIPQALQGMACQLSERPTP